MKTRSFLLLSGMCLGCLEPQLLYEVEISGSVSSTDEGPVELWFLHSEWGEDALKTEFMVFDKVWIDQADPFSETIQVPQGLGSGLSVYGWQDRNEDQEHCRPGTDPELSGLVEIEDYPAHAVEMMLSLETPCKGPEGL